MSSILSIFFVLFLISCGDNTASRKKIKLNQEGVTSLLVTGFENAQEIKNEARKLNIEVTGEHVLILKGYASDIEALEFNANKNFDYLTDGPLTLVKPEAFAPDHGALYLAKKDFGIPEFWKNHPEADGRGVTVGVIDDGISPHQQGFILTSTGERKFLSKASQSTFTTFSLSETSEGLITIVDEKRPGFGVVDLNADGKFSSWKIKVSESGEEACLDINTDETFSPDECAGSFKKSGGFIRAIDKRLVLMFEIDREKKLIKVFQPEKGADSHGEGVAAVLAGYKIGNLKGFDGVAPGAKMVDYDLSEITDRPEEAEYTLGTFINALEWVAKEGAEVANISYSFGFTSAKTQVFMSKAIDEIVKKHNIVISFSAGNNGPGLGSLNRRSIYPSSVLVAGAFISKELDERVHGVTGVPDEGRLVYYSSRGPGLGIGPLLISPLSSLVNSSPDTGYRAFSGTSSASPALAGAATVLISAIKQENLKVDATTVVNALRLSGRRLKAEPFIFQGHGLPQVGEALRIYKELINGERFQDIRVTVDRENIDGISPRGIFIRTSEVKSLTTRKIAFNGILSSLANDEARVNLLTPVKILYSKGITGAKEIWISSSASNLAVDINPEDVLQGKLEGFGEIHIHSSLDNSLLVIVPVTVVNDQNILENPTEHFGLTSQEGLRFPVYIPEGVKGFRVNAEVIEGDEKAALLSVFDPHHIRVVQQRLGNDIWFPTSESGFYQVGIAMTGGTPRGLKVRISLRPIKLTVRSKVTSAQTPSVTVTNHMAPLSAHLKITPLPKVVETVILSSRDILNGASLEKTLEEGSYSVEFSSTRSYDLVYLFSTCTIKEQKADGALKYTEGNALTVPASGMVATFRCMPFDRGGIFEEVYEWNMKLLKNGKSLSGRMDISREQTSSIRFPEATPGRYKVEIEDPFSTSSIVIGEIDLI
jgi:subtilisin family serine protease